MARSEAVRRSSQYYCYHLSDADETDERDVMLFEPVDASGAGLALYLQNMAFAEEDAGTMRTYLVRDNVTDELVGYFSLKAGLVSLDERKDDENPQFDTVPGIELANFAVNNAYRQAHPASKGAGALIFHELVLPLVNRAAEQIGVFLLYIYSLPYERLMRNYATYGFSRLSLEEEALLHARLKPRYDAQCVFMYMPI